MPKRWTLEEDIFLARFFDVVGDMTGTHDLGRPKGAATARVKALEVAGAWAILREWVDADAEWEKRCWEMERDYSARLGLTKKAQAAEDMIDALYGPTTADRLADRAVP